MLKFNVGLAHERLTEPGIHISGGGTRQSIGGRCVHGLFPVCSKYVWVVGLAASFIPGVGSVGVAGGCCAGRVAFEVKFAALVSFVDLATWLMLIMGVSLVL
ncbi:hypothetical protein F1880_006469 [Penicillium rolfsii]|nr:hypothetical protein F1880_006469 [Penicillium rolfsii]